MTQFLPRPSLQTLIDALINAGYQVVGPRVDQGAIVYDQIASMDDLPKGWTDEQKAGQYRLVPRADESVFGYVVGPHSWKKYLFPPQLLVMAARRTAEGWEMSDPPAAAPAYAFLGVRACELAAMAMQDKVFMAPEHTDPVYAERRRKLFVVAVQCTQAATTCFCTSMGTGPECQAGFDLALTELPDGFSLEVGSEKGQAIASQLPLRPITPEERTDAQQRRAQAVQQISKTMPTDGLKEKLLTRLEHPRYESVADRCLACANCTLVCPTCFCHSVDEVSDLTNEQYLRERRWDSCFNLDFSHLSSGPVRNQIRSRYRQWITHKLASWWDQFGSSGCVGCGRCITWCPVAIDITEEAAAICQEPLTKNH